MPIYLNESQFGMAHDRVGFPHLLVCMGFVAMTGSYLWGMHSDVKKDIGKLALELRRFMVEQWHTSPSNIIKLWGCCNWNVRYKGDADKRLAWQQEMQLVAQVFDFQGTVRGFDTSVIAPRDGTYVEYYPRYAQQECRIYYKRNEKMVYQNTNHYAEKTELNSNLKKFRGDDPVVNVPIETTGAVGNLHEVDYNVRLQAFDILPGGVMTNQRVGQ
jgi:hypothetical protein